MLEQILVIVGVTFLVMLSPGPDMVIVLRNTLIGGRRTGRLTSLGVLAGNLVHIGYCVLGIGIRRAHSSISGYSRRSSRPRPLRPKRWCSSPA